MCDNQTEQDNEQYERLGGTLNRRQFGAFTAATLFSLFYTDIPLAEETTLSEKNVLVPMSEGVSDSFFVHPAEGEHPGILMWPDIRGLRPTFQAMAKRLALNGYSVLVVNPFYRDAKAPVVDPSASFRDPEIRKILIPMYQNLNHKASMSDAIDYIKYLDQQSAVDNKTKIGTVGYCMGGPLIMRTAGAVPDRVGAAASFHGGGLVTDAEDSPHLLIPKSPAQILHAIAENDDERYPEVKNILAQAYKKAGVAAEIEVYDNTLHGWCPPDSRVYNEQQAERAWHRMLALFRRSLV